MDVISRNHAEKIELHYYFDDDSHSMDAFIRNKCEAELLGLIKEIADELGITSLELESEAYAEGGLIDRIKVIAKKNPVISAIFIGVLINVISNHITTDRELNTLQKKALKLQIEQMQQEMGKTDSVTSTIHSTESTTTAIIENTAIRKRRSNFYENLIKCRKVLSLELNGVDANNTPVRPPVPVVRIDFDKFIVSSDKLEPIIDEDALIEIISPVLKDVQKNYKWVGLYRGERIIFSIKDSDFKKDVVDGKVPFKNGTCIDCVLTIARKLDDQGVEKVTGYSTDLIKNIHDEDVTKETPQGKKFRRMKKHMANSLEFDFASDNSSDSNQS